MGIPRKACMWRWPLATRPVYGQCAQWYEYPLSVDVYQSRQSRGPEVRNSRRFTTVFYTRVDPRFLQPYGYAGS
eukprot:4440661-Prymnesium_polylepis.2